MGLGLFAVETIDGAAPAPKYSSSTSNRPTPAQRMRRLARRDLINATKPNTNRKISGTGNFSQELIPMHKRFDLTLASALLLSAVPVAESKLRASTEASRITVHGGSADEHASRDDHGGVLLFWQNFLTAGDETGAISPDRPTRSPTEAFAEPTRLCGGSRTTERDMSESYAVRCCSTGPNLEWEERCDGIYSQSSIGGECLVVPFRRAVEECGLVGGRLCTLGEMKSRCAKDSGCGFNRKYVWVGADENDSCETSAECLSGRCVNGLCRLGFTSNPPTGLPTNTVSGPTISPTPSPTKVSMSPTKSPSGSPQIKYYGYNLDESSKCNGDGATNWQGPAPYDDKSNTVVQFFAWGDAPYDSNCDICNTCIAEDGVTKESECTRFNCIVRNKDIESLPIQNTCTYEGYEYHCIRDKLIPYMNAKMDSGDASFSVHVGDIIKGTTPKDGGIGGNRRCTISSFTSRRDLFHQLNNFLLVVGDNEWQDCIGYDIVFQHGKRPLVSRMASNPEIFHFEYNGSAYFGLNRGQGTQFIGDISEVDFNALWVEQQLALDTTCQLKSVVFISHIGPSSDVRNKLSEYFSRCSTLPTLSIKGNDHPSTYCLSMDTEHQLELTIEAARSGPVLVSIVEDPDSGAHFFHIHDPDKNDSSSTCPELKDHTFEVPRPVQITSHSQPTSKSTRPTALSSSRLTALPPASPSGAPTRSPTDSPKIPNKWPYQATCHGEPNYSALFKSEPFSCCQNKKNTEATHSFFKPSVKPTMQPTPTGPLTFLAIGDVPYSPMEECLLPIELNKLTTSSGRFLVHLGDIQDGKIGSCPESLHLGVSELFASSPLPTLFVIGDNGWLDCDNPDESYGYWKEHLFDFHSRSDLNWPPLGTSVERDPVYPEFFSFELESILFVGQGLPASRNPRGDYEEYLVQNAAYARAKIEESSQTRALVLLGHSFGNGRGSKRSYFEFVLQIAAENPALPILMVQDNHWYDVVFHLLLTYVIIQTHYSDWLQVGNADVPGSSESL
ncbi:hypothetical protein THAOC_24535 [Thalassiosira oceanica]|uniref:Calcineurin-like phosphoesterase domain-containing protein n=1 Tax=Thalassiosira oceanica TaxID=159749 RepID=K0RTN6_THAOC|nr:hypothetical protein THAOC_24535 [Thalassiosira oceanica]|eukprot:EJK55704.1 hypothetical protein THAOC_24535 [Thalassiosira oceanica]